MGIIAFLLAVIAIKVILKFDINDYLKERRKIKINQLKNICPHLTAKPDGDRIITTSFFSSPVGTRNYICSQCGLVIGSEEEVERIMQRYKENPVRILKDQNKFIKKAKKLKLL